MSRRYWQPSRERQINALAAIIWLVEQDAQDEKRVASMRQDLERLKGVGSRTSPRLTAAEVAAYMSISRSTVDKLVRGRDLPPPIGLTPRLER